ncbi:MAG: DUF554 domain-containing protein [Candidatus Rokubacteria bacterium]|nr:DUF554 domain-containing protein [Candidatus Rokubacteria bacterium]
MKGTFVNVAAVLLGGGLGLLVGSRLPERLRDIITDGLGLATMLIGLRLALKADNMLIVIGSLVAGGLLGEWWNLERRLEDAGAWLKARTGPRAPEGERRFVAGFVTASLVYCVGPMTIVGSIQAGIDGKVEVLYAKSMLDGAASVAFASSLGVGVLFSALTVLIVQGGLTLLGSQLTFLLDPRILNEVTGTGGALILGIGLLLLEIRRLRIANFLPALPIAAALAALAR